MARRGSGTPMVSSASAEGGLPRPVYEALPIVYLGMAIALVLMVDSPLIFLSSALFGAAGVGVLWMRMRHRRGM
ncbi:MAG TPA: hypothetical protein VKA55_02680 [Gammaproteobacteria bacterium]|nr:hypothetical protein [Gammaproteobacteria bacterium]